MKFGVVFPQTEFGNDVSAIKDYTRTAEDLGYDHILAYDHVLGANPEREGGWNGPYTFETPFHEVFVLFSFMAGITSTIEFVTGILILPQRQTALVAKQTAELDLLSEGRLRLGVGIGWNKVEYIALGQDFHVRGKRIEAQVELLRKLWQEPLVIHNDEWHQIPDAGIEPRSPREGIPIWFGGHVDAVLRRIARMGDGWLPNYRNLERAGKALADLDRYLEEEGRSRADVGIEARLSYGDGDEIKWAEVIDGWSALGATHITFNTMGAGLSTPGEHIDAISQFRRWLDNRA